jgi:hypothetical protein
MDASVKGPRLHGIPGVGGNHPTVEAAMPTTTHVLD